MREFKFRCFRKSLNKFINNFDITPSGEIQIFIQYDGINNITSDCELMQYTGLKDRNGKEIYEGDIIQQINNKGGTPYEFIGIVEYNETGFCLRCSKGAEINSYYAFSHYDENKNLKKGEVIGNIYQTDIGK